MFPCKYLTTVRTSSVRTFMLNLACLSTDAWFLLSVPEPWVCFYLQHGAGRVRGCWVLGHLLHLIPGTVGVLPKNHMVIARARGQRHETITWHGSLCHPATETPTIKQSWVEKTHICSCSGGRVTTSCKQSAFKLTTRVWQCVWHRARASLHPSWP